MIRRLKLGVVCVALVLALAGLASAQTATTGQITGTVVDPTGAVLPQAKLVLTSDTGITRETVSDGAGRYAFTLLPPGRYKLDVTAQGFGTAKFADVLVRITETTSLEIGMKVGVAAKETVEVSAEPPLVQAESATTGKVIEQDTIRQLPLPTRNFQQLLTLTPGASGGLQNSSELGRGDATISVNGARQTSNSVVINGIDANSIGTGSTPNLAVPATDSLQEFIVQTSLYDASQGRAVGGIVAAVTKSGTDKFHGNVYEFFRDDTLNANNYFLTKSHIAQPVYERNQFGGTFGGPIVKNRAWFFLSYQGTRETNGTSLTNSLATVFTPGNLTNDRTATTLASKYGPINSVALAVLQAKLPNGNYLFPSSNIVSTSSAAVPVTIPDTSKYTENQANINFDYRISDKDRFSVKLFGANNPTTQALYTFAGIGNPIQAPGAPTSFDIRNRLATVSEQHMFSSRLINEARFGYSEIFGPFHPAEPFKASDFGITSPLSSLYPGAPTIEISNLMDLGPSPLSDQTSQTKTYTVNDMVSWSIGRHMLKFGGEYKHNEANLTFNAYTRGFVLYSSFALFTAGVPTATIMGSGDTSRENRSNDYGLFLQDDWKVNNRLTINAGIRWDYYGPFTEAKGRFVAFDPTLATTTGTGLSKVLTAGFVQAGNGTLTGIPKVQDGLVDSDLNNFGPRIGFAFKPFKDNNSLVVRGGYGMYYDRPNSRLYNSQVFNSPYYTLAVNVASATTWPNPNDPFFHVPLPSAFPLSFGNATLFPGGGPPAYMTASTKAIVGGSILTLPLSLPVPSSGIYPERHNFVDPLIHQYNLGMQYEFARNWLLDMSFVGTNGRDLLRLISLNPQPTAGNVLGTPYFPAISPYISGTAGAMAAQSSGISNFTSLQTSLTKRMSKGLQFLASYTYGHSLDTYSGGDVNDLVGMSGNPNFEYYATSDFDRRHRFVGSYVYDVPKLYRGSSKAMQLAFNGFELAGIYTAQTGTPFSIVGATPSLASNVFADFATAGVTGAKSGPVKDRLTSYFDTTAYVAPAAGTWGHTRNVLRGPAQVNTDFSVVKFFQVTERQRAEFRTEFFNIFNTANFANPVNVRTSSSFGQIVKTSTGPRVIQFAFKYSF